MNKQVKISFKGVNDNERMSVLDALKKIGLDQISSCHDNDTNRHTHRLAVSGELNRIIVTTPDELIEIEDKPFAI